MSKQVKTYSLLAVVLIVWGLIGFKVVNAISPYEEVPIEKAPTIQVTEARIKKDTFTLFANYRDPFLGTMPKSNISKKAKPTGQKKELRQNNISYSGSVAQNGTANRMFFVTIDGQQHIMSKNETVKDVKLVSGNSEYIKIRYGGHTKTILLQQ